VLGVCFFGFDNAFLSIRFPSDGGWQIGVAWGLLLAVRKKFDVVVYLYFHGGFGWGWMVWMGL
jgi:hypothetical protein